MTSEATKLKRFEENGVVYFQLYLCCPICWERGKSSGPSYWQHAENNCRGDIFVGDNAHFKCMKCGMTSHVKDWCYRCPCHSDSSGFEIRLASASICGIEAMRSIGAMVTVTGQRWLMQFMNNVGEW